MALTNAQKQRKIRQDTLREWLSEKCTAQHLIDNINKIEELDPKSDTFNNELNKYKTANDQRIRVLSKYLPDLKATELTGDGGDPIELDHTIQVEFINLEDSDS